MFLGESLSEKNVVQKSCEQRSGSPDGAHESRINSSLKGEVKCQYHQRLVSKVNQGEENEHQNIVPISAPCVFVCQIQIYFETTILSFILDAEVCEENKST